MSIFEYKGRKVEIKSRNLYVPTQPVVYEVWFDGEYADRCRATEHEAITAAHTLIDAQEAK